MRSRRILLVLGILALVAFMTMVSSSGGTTTVSANNPTPTPGFVKPTPSAQGPNSLSDIVDLNARMGGPGGEEQLSCISRVDHAVTATVGDRELIKTSTQCYINSAGLGDLANVLLGVNVPCGDKAPPGTANPPFCPDGSREGIDCTGGAPPLSNPSCAFLPSNTAIIGPPPPPPYSALPPQKGIGFYDPLGTSPECLSANGGNPGQPCSVVRSCFSDVGAVPLGPNVGTMLVIPNPLGSQTPIAKLKLVKQISNKECDNLTFKPTAPLYGGLYVTVTESDDPPLSYRGVDASCAADYTTCDFDGDGCPDFDELAKPGTQPKGCGDDPWNPNDSNKTDFSGAYEILFRVLRPETTPGFAGIYFNCLADINQTGTGKTDGDLKARAFCYLDGFLQEVNKLDSPGVKGDGQAGGAPPFGALPIEPPCANPLNCTLAEQAFAETDCTRALHGTGTLDEDGDTKANDGCPSEAFGDVDSKHPLLTGFVDNTPGVNAIKLRGCFVDEDVSSSGGTVYVEMTVGKNTGQGSVDIWINQTIADCKTNGPYAFGTYATVAGAPPVGNFAGALVRMVRQPGGDLRDTDQDGAPDASELVDAVNQNTCGGRDPFNPYDHYDVNQDGLIDLLTDIMGVINHWQPTAGGAPPYDVLFDRGPTMIGAVGHWNRGAPDGVIDLANDIHGVILQWHPLPCGPGGKAPSPPASPTNAAMSISVDGAHTTSCPVTKVNGETCVGFNNAFDVIVSANTIPVAGYLLAQAWVDFDNQGLTWSANNTTWPDCALADLGGLQGNAAMQGCITGTDVSSVSFHTGELFRISLTCTSTASESVLRLIPSNTPPAGTNGALFTNVFGLQEIPSVGGDLLVNCVVGPPTLTPTPTPTPTITPTPTKQPFKGDTDGDGCADVNENLPKAEVANGGGRDYLNPWDYYDVNGDGVIDLINDIVGVIDHWQPNVGGAPPYDIAFDRGPTAGPNPWNMTAPDGVIDLINDVLGVIDQFAPNGCT